MAGLNTLTFTMLAQKVMEAFVSKITPIRAFATNFSEAETQRGDKVKVMFVGQQSAARDFANSYTMDGLNADGLDITIDKRKYVSFNLTTQDLWNMPQVNAERFAAQKGYQLAKAVLQDIWSLSTQANFGAPIWSGSPANFDNDDVIDIGSTCDEAEWPDEMRSLILKPRYHGALKKDKAIVGTLGVNQSSVIKVGELQQLNDFDLYKSNLIPSNNEALVGMAVHPDSILIAGRALVPEKNRLLDVFEKFTDKDLGLTCTYREWFDGDSDEKRRVFECNYGRRMGNSAALKPLSE